MGRMKREKIDYYEMYRESARIAKRAAEALSRGFSDGKINISEIQAIKDIEHEGDTHLHSSLAIIERAFITPIDPEKMMGLMRGIEGFIDAIDQISQYMYMMRIEESNEHLDAFVKLLVDASAVLVTLTNDLNEHKRKQAELRQLVIDINHIEDAGDATYIKAMHELFSGAYEPLYVMRYERIYSQMENALDYCEDVADTIEEIMISEG